MSGAAVPNGSGTEEADRMEEDGDAPAAKAAPSSDSAAPPAPAEEAPAASGKKTDLAPAANMKAGLETPAEAASPAATVESAAS